MNIIFMNLTSLIFITFFFAIGYCLNDTNETDDARKRYGYGFYGSCGDHEKVFICMTKCQSLDYEVYRLDHNCKCTCHNMRSTLALPYFQWLTTGTPKTLPTTRSPRLWDVAGTLSPNPFKTTTTIEDNNTCPTLYPVTATNHTKVPLPQNTPDGKTNETESNGTGPSNQTESNGTGSSNSTESHAPGPSNQTESSAPGTSNQSESHETKSNQTGESSTNTSADTKPKR